jgi:hypothetical protein
MRLFTALFFSIVTALGLPAAAGTVSHGFNVTVDLNGAGGVKVDARAQEAIALGGGGHSVTVANALVLGRFPSRALRMQLEIVDPAVKSVEVLGLGAPVHLERGPRSVLVPSEGADGPVTLSYVVHYADGGGQPARVPLRATIVP